ncbi:4-(cytidine 5'-diphospho)-2-C-methyl-D-erythritol kinase [Pseudomarimonas salicorniae]|uniref:4-diphosphocytidyl-2-C-methyl-D-erythritol kinase n=1 Tax=Pseudomarimonas salicorniae TaxID=2933270 RepID=A0ABT0GIA7_9GAMM|nr:4-(cytidine 5'-diphospho)-2-C-methyl-D-erythritol kinase [Lysobacter sp. CAU 1642]MCK7594289.1 4-(cytidine 5'-diphospho)-2-C-methyl-D-erythritol kinase [Lysobacter sp. CAU 1642]
MHPESASTWPAPAKLNLFLQITGRRDDGYHLLQTVFQLLDWGDAISLAPRSDGRIQRLGGPPGVAEEDDLSVRSARLLQRATGCAVGVDITLDKRIPQGGGFGGGSSDAATVLCALNALWGCELGEDALAELAVQLGADVPVFVRGRTAWAEGVGESLRPLDLPGRWFVLVDAGVHLSTAELFQAPELTRNAPPLTMADFASDLVGRNAFDAPARARSPLLAELLHALRARAAGGLTGTGGGCFAMVDTKEQAEALAGDLARFGRCIVAKGVNRSPLHDRLEAWRAERSAAPAGA